MLCQYTSDEIKMMLEECLNIGSFADTLVDTPFVLDGVFNAKVKVWNLEHIEETAKGHFGTVLKQLLRLPKALALAQDRLEAYWADRDAWVYGQAEYKRLTDDDWNMCTEDIWTDKYDRHVGKMDKGVEMCRFFQLPIGCRAGDDCEYSHDVDTCSTVSDGIHRDENGEPEICRYFNTPSGCTREADGKGACPYKHIDGVIPEPELCRFFNAPGGCRKGAACIFKHELIVAPIEKDWRSGSPVDDEGWTVSTSQKQPRKAVDDKGWNSQRPPKMPRRAVAEGGFGIAMRR